MRFTDRYTTLQNHSFIKKYEGHIFISKLTNPYCIACMCKLCMHIESLSNEHIRELCRKNF